MSSLLESRVQFKAVDMPEADHFTIHIIAAVAERAARDISLKTAAGLGAKKERMRGGDLYNSRRNADGSLVKMKPDKNGQYRLGNPNGYTEQMREKAKVAKREKADKNPHTRMAKERIQQCLRLNPRRTSRQTQSVSYPHPFRQTLYPLQRRLPQKEPVRVSISTLFQQQEQGSLDTSTFS